MNDKAKTYCKRWYQEVGKQREAIWRVELKKEVLTHYGEGALSCVTCGESRVDCLSIDHINGGGASHRKELNAYGYRFYKRLKRDNYPDGYQTLCMNCQFIKAVSDRAKYKEIPSGN